MNTHLEYIVKKCAEANPEIMELKFGCEIYHGVTAIFLGINNNGELWVSEEGQTKTKFWGISDIKILGREIQLSDVLLLPIGPIFIDNWGCFWKFTKSLHSYEIESCKIYWNLLKPLSGQSPETLAFLAELLT